MSNSASDLARPFHERFRALWRQGQGRGVLAARRRGHTGEDAWNTPEFCDALANTGGKVSAEMVNRWHAGRNLPRKPQMEAILRVFFSATVEGKPRFDPDAAEPEHLRGLWTQAHALRQRKNKAPPPAPANQPEDWWLEGGHQFPDLVTFQTFQPVPLPSGADHYEVPAILTFGRAAPEDETGAFRFDLSLTNAWLEVPVTSYQPSPDGVIGDLPKPGDKVEKQPNGRYKIVGPTSDGALEGEVFGTDDRFLRVEPAARRGGPLAPRIAAAATELTVRVTDTATGETVGTDRAAVLKLLLANGCRRDDATGRIVLAERLLTRKSVRS